MSNAGIMIDQLHVSLTGRIIYHCLPYRKKIIRSNIEQAYGNQLTSYQKQHLIKAFYSHLATSLKEGITLRFMGETKLRDRVEVRGHERLLNVAAKNRGVLVLTGHFGNWEFAPIGGILNFKQFQGQFHFIRRTLGNKIGRAHV